MQLLQGLPFLSSGLESLGLGEIFVPRMAGFLSLSLGMSRQGEAQSTVSPFITSILCGYELFPPLAWKIDSFDWALAPCCRLVSIPRSMWL